MVDKFIEILNAKAKIYQIDKTLEQRAQTETYVFILVGVSCHPLRLGRLRLRPLLKKLVNLVGLGLRVKYLDELVDHSLVVLGLGNISFEGFLHISCCSQNYVSWHNRRMVRHLCLNKTVFPVRIPFVSVIQHL